MAKDLTDRGERRLPACRIRQLAGCTCTRGLASDLGNSCGWPPTHVFGRLPKTAGWQPALPSRWPGQITPHNPQLTTRLGYWNLSFFGACNLGFASSLHTAQKRRNTRTPRDQPPLRKRQRSVAARSPYFASAAELVKKPVSGLVALAVWRDSTRPIS